MAQLENFRQDYLKDQIQTKMEKVEKIEKEKRDRDNARTAFR